MSHRSPHLVSLVVAGCAFAVGASGQHQVFRFDAHAAGDEFGCAVAGAGDVNGDGRGDIVVGSRREDAQGPDAGAIRVYSGADGSQLLFVRGRFTETYGWSVAGAGDVDGDGFDDVVAGAPGSITAGIGSGRVEVISGRTGLVLHVFPGAAPGDRFGYSVAGGGDVDGDGFDDIVAGAPYADVNGAESGSVTILSGRTGALLQLFHGDDAADLFGFSVAMTGDLDGDGLADVVAGALRDDDNGIDCGAARVFSGRTGAVLRTVYGDSAGDRLGVSVSGAGDSDRDGRADVVLGANEDDFLARGAGSALVCSGLDGHLMHRLLGNPTPGNFGVNVSCAGDVDGDGYGDSIVGSPLDASEGPATGAASVFSGFDGALLHRFYGDSEGDHFGWSVGCAGDVDGDGFDEIVVGAIADGIGGSVRVLHVGGIGTPPRQRTFGSGCIGANARLPRIGWSGDTRIGTTFTVTLRGGAVQAENTVFFVGDPIGVPLDALGLAGCTLHVAPFGPVRTTTTALGTASVGLAFPDDQAMIGIPFYAQWVILDPGAPWPLPVATSDALEMVVGR